MNRDGRNIKIINDAAGWNYDINISPQTTGADVINSMLQDRVIDHCD